MNVTPERWQQVARIYELVVDHDPATRDTDLSRLCGEDESLLGEVRSLLSQDDASVILDRPVWTTAARLFQNEPDLAPGVLLGPYRIDGPLGAGGMGEVFSATDIRLNRRVALKVLRGGADVDQDGRARFKREAEAVAALTHPHVCTLYDVGCHDEVDYLVMEHLEGETLAERLATGPLPFAEALEHAKEIAGALDHAHRRGVIHRDVKPANNMLTAGGAKLLDFGLAAFRTARGQRDVNAPGARSAVDPGAGTGHAPITGQHSHQTDGGTILGTVRYMAPEQIAGHELDARADLFAFGAVLHELFTGRKAFEGETFTEIREAILESEPPPVSWHQPLAPPLVDEVVRRCVAKDRDERWPTAADVLHRLEQVSAPTHPGRLHARAASAWPTAVVMAAVIGLVGWLFVSRLQPQSTTAPVSAIRSIAVLPLEDVSDDSDQGYFADGMTERLIADLATVTGLRVISRTSAMHYRGARKPMPAIARELRVDGIIEGSIAHVGDAVRVTARLIEGTSGKLLWTQSFEREVRDVLALQRELARAISTRVDMTLAPRDQARLALADPVDPEGHRQVLLGRHHAAKATEEGLRKALQHFGTALARSPDTAAAHAGLAEAYMGLSGLYVPPREAMPQAKRAAQTAIGLDETMADAHAVLGYIHLVYDWDGPAARTALLRALDLNPTLATARLHYAAYLTTQARHEEAVREIRRAVEFDPVSVRTNAIATSLLLFARQYDEAIELARRGFEFEPNAFALAFQGVAYAEQGRFGAAVDNMARASRMDASATILSLQAHVLALAGQKAEARRLIRQVEQSTKGRYFCPYEIATAHVSLGDADTAYRWFRKGVEDRADCMAWLGVEPWVESFRSDARYPGLLREIGLDPAVR